jgi:hypothetical protein
MRRLLEPAREEGTPTVTARTSSKSSTSEHASHPRTSHNDSLRGLWTTLSVTDCTEQSCKWSQICQTLLVRRSLAGLLLLVSCVLMAISISTWWFQHVAFSPSTDTSVAHAILGDAEIRSDVATLIASADAAPLNVSTTQLKEFVQQISRLNDGAALMRGFVSDAHARLIGENDAPVIITPTEQYTIVRDERAALSPDLTLPVPIVGSLSFINTATRWIMIASAAGALLLFIAGFLTRPERGELTFALAVGLAVTGVGVIFLGYLVPVGPLTGLSESTWMGVFPRLANKSLGSTLLLGITSIVSGVIIMLGTTSLRQRRQRSTPLSVSRYREQQAWSR